MVLGLEIEFRMGSGFRSGGLLRIGVKGWVDRSTSYVGVWVVGCRGGGGL